MLSRSPTDQGALRSRSLCLICSLPGRWQISEARPAACACRRLDMCKT